MDSLIPHHHHHLRSAENPGGGFLWRRVMIATCAGFLLPVLLPFFHLGILSHLWDEYNYKVDRLVCSCPCWDTIFKGIYERGPAGYKHIYFNITSNTFKIWCVTVLAILLLYEAFKRVVKLSLYREIRLSMLVLFLSSIYPHYTQIRLSMLVLFLSSIYPHYYSWWSYFNYWNDDYYHQWNHQLFFSITELASTIAVVYLLDKNVNVTPQRALIIINIAVLHIVTSGFDQFVTNVVQGNGMLHQVLRDIFFMIPDLLHLSLPILELRMVAKTHQVPTMHLISNREFTGSIAFVLVGWFVCWML